MKLLLIALLAVVARYSVASIAFGMMLAAALGAADIVAVTTSGHERGQSPREEAAGKSGSAILQRPRRPHRSPAAALADDPQRRQAARRELGRGRGGGRRSRNFGLAHDGGEAQRLPDRGRAPVKSCGREERQRELRAWCWATELFISGGRGSAIGQLRARATFPVSDQTVRPRSPKNSS